jgi:hypothetical protein
LFSQLCPSALGRAPIINTAISRALEDKGHLNELGRPFNHESIRVMFTKRA